MRVDRGRIWSVTPNSNKWLVLSQERLPRSPDPGPSFEMRKLRPGESAEA